MMLGRGISESTGMDVQRTRQSLVIVVGDPVWKGSNMAGLAVAAGAHRESAPAGETHRHVLVGSA